MQTYDDVLICPECRRAFRAMRPDITKYCTDKCKRRAARKRKLARDRGTLATTPVTVFQSDGAMAQLKKDETLEAIDAAKDKLIAERQAENSAMITKILDAPVTQETKDEIQRELERKKKRDSKEPIVPISLDVPDEEVE